MGFLRFCKEVRRPASITLIKGYLDELSMQGKLVAEAREALRWFVVAGRRQAQLKMKGEVDGVELRGLQDESRRTDARPPVGPTPERTGAGPGATGYRGDTRPAVGHERETASAVPLRERASDRSMPSIGAEGMSGPEWEQALVKAARTKGLMWRTEQTYRGWAQRFVEFMFPRNPRLADKAAAGVVGKGSRSRSAGGMAAGGARPEVSGRRRAVALAVDVPVEGIISRSAVGCPAAASCK